MSYDVVRRKYLKKLAAKTKRNVIIYYSAWLQKSELLRQQPWELMINDADKNGLMATIFEMDRSKGLDLEQLGRRSAPRALLRSRNRRAPGRSCRAR